MYSCGHTDGRGAGGNVGEHNGVGTDSGACPNSNGTEDLGPAADLHVGADGGSSEIPTAQSNRHEWSDADVGTDGGNSVYHHLSVQEIEPGCDYHGIPDGNLGACHGQPVGHPR